MKDLTKQQTEYAIGCLKDIYTRRGLNQTQLGQLADVPQPTISKIFSGETGVTYGVLKKLCHALEVRVDDILGERAESIHDLCGYLATPLSGLTTTAETEIQRLVGAIRATAHAFSEPRIDLYWPGDHTHPTRNPDIKAEDVYLLDRSRAAAHDFAVLLCAAPSYGVGQENEIATQAGLPAIRIVPAGMSRMISGSFLQAIEVPYTGFLEAGIQLDQVKLHKAFEDIQPIYFKHRALYRSLDGNSFGDRLKTLVDKRSGGYMVFAKELGVALSYVHALMGEQLVVSNPSAQLLKRMALLLGTSVGYLMGEREAADPIKIESKASWNKWIGNTDVRAAVAAELWDEWVDQYHLEQNQATTASFRKSTRALIEADWQKRHEQKLRKAGANATGQLFR